jgi:hypothetical protein
MQGTLVLTNYSDFEEQCRAHWVGSWYEITSVLWDVYCNVFLKISKIKTYDRFCQYYYNSKLYVYNSLNRLKQQKQMRKKQCQNQSKD